MMHAATRRNLEHRTSRINLGAELPRHPQITEGELRRMDAGAERFMHSANALPRP